MLCDSQVDMPDVEWKPYVTSLANTSRLGNLYDIDSWLLQHAERGVGSRTDNHSPPNDLTPYRNATLFLLNPSA